MLRDLRPAGTTLRVIPRGFLFERVSCPHYSFEICSWIGFALVAQTWSALAFLVVGAFWARGRTRGTRPISKTSTVATAGKSIQRAAAR